MKTFAATIALGCVVLVGSAQPQYSGAYGSAPHCQACHSGANPPTNQFPLWNQTPHAGAYDDHPEIQWDDECLPCHTTGWDLTQTNHGFDDYFYQSDTLGMLQMRNVQCEACHGPTDQFPHPLTTAVNYHAEVCGSCHTGLLGRNTYEEWSSCRHGQIASSSAQQLACAKCHEAVSASVYLSTGSAPPSLPSEPLWQVTCATCHAAHERNLYGAQLYQPADDLCRSCHTLDGATVGEVPHAPQNEMVLGPGFGGFEWPGFFYNNSCHETYLPQPCVICHMWTPAWGNPDTTTTGHQVTPIVQNCATIGCHTGQIPPDSSFNINGCQSMIDSLLVSLGEVLDQADTTTLSYRQAKFDYDFVTNDGSYGVHNFFYARDLIESSIEGLLGHPYIEVELMPMCMMVHVPSMGGSFDFDLMIHNHMSAPRTFDAWIMLRLPSGVWEGPLQGPVRLTLPGMAELSRMRTQTIAGTYPNGTYTYRSYVGDYYASDKWDSSSFTFTKGMCADGFGGGEVLVDGGESGFAPDGFFGMTASPNPFNAATVASFELPVASYVNLEVYDASGRQVSTLVDGWREAGTHEITFDARDLPSGVYYCRLQAGDFSAMQKLVLLK